MPRRRSAGTSPVVHRTARIGLRLTQAQLQRCFGLLRSAGDVWVCVLEINAWRRRRNDKPAASYQELCRLLAQAGPGTFGELDSTGARSVLRRYSDAWFAAAARRRSGHAEVCYPRRRRALMPIRWHHGTYGLTDTKHRSRATATHAPNKGQRGSRRWRKTRRRARLIETRHRRRVRQALHEAAKMVVGWAVSERIGTLTVGDPRGVLDKDAGRRHNLRLRQWQIGRTLRIFQDKAALAGIRVHLVDERGTSSTCPTCRLRISKPRGRVMSCRHCQFAGHRDVAAAFTIATRTPGGVVTISEPACSGVLTHRRAGTHLPGQGPARRDPRRPPPRAATGSVGQRRPAPPLSVGSRSFTPVAEDPQTLIETDLVNV